jgi:hypothetical protein
MNGKCIKKTSEDVNILEAVQVGVAGRKLPYLSFFLHINLL